MDRPIPPKTRRLSPRTLQFAALFAFVALAALLWMMFGHAARLDVQGSEIGSFGTSSNPATVSIRAVAQPDELGIVSSPITGMVIDLEVENEQLVERGQILARLSNTGLRLEIARTQAQLMSEIGAIERTDSARELEISDAESSLQQTSLELEDSAARLAQLRPLFERGLYPGREFQTLELHHNGLVRQAAHQRERIVLLRTQTADQAEDQSQRLARLRESLEISEGMMASFDVLSPMDGRLLGFDLIAGQAVSEGQQLGRVQTEERTYLQAQLDQFYLNRVSAGFAAHPVDSQYGEYLVRRRGATITDGRFMVELIAAPSAQPTRPLVLGEALTLSLELAPLNASDDGLIESSAVVVENGVAYVYVVSADDTEARPIRVSLGERTSDDRQVIVDGLSPGTRFLTTPPPGNIRTYQIAIRN